MLTYCQDESGLHLDRRYQSQTDDRFVKILVRYRYFETIAANYARISCENYITIALDTCAKQLDETRISQHSFHLLDPLPFLTERVISYYKKAQWVGKRIVYEEMWKRRLHIERFWKPEVTVSQRISFWSLGGYECDLAISMMRTGNM